MLFNRYQVPFIKQCESAIVYQLTNTELEERYKIGITHIGAVLDIYKTNKEDTLMVEKLKVYLHELQVKAAALQTEDYSKDIEERTAAYKAELTAKYEAERAEKLAKVNSDVECITAIIVREEELAAQATEIPTATE